MSGNCCITGSLPMSLCFNNFMASIMGSFTLTVITSLLIQFLTNIFSSFPLLADYIPLHPRHSRSALRALLLVTGGPQLMGCSFSTVGPAAITARACRKTASLAPATTALPSAGAASTHSSTCSGSLTSWSCSVSSWHFIYHLFDDLIF